VPFRLLAVMYTKNRLAICQKTGFPPAREWHGRRLGPLLFI